MIPKHKPTSKSRFKQGYFTPTNPAKYIGNLKDIRYLSSWERRVMVWFDTNPNVIAWNSENLQIRYFYPVDNKEHTYMVDFLVKMKDKNGVLNTYAIEIKPEAEKYPPTTKNKKRLLVETQTYIKNQCKWKAAKEYCDSQNVKFLVLSEKDLGIT